MNSLFRVSLLLVIRSVLRCYPTQPLLRHISLIRRSKFLIRAFLFGSFLVAGVALGTWVVRDTAGGIVQAFALDGSGQGVAGASHDVAPSRLIGKGL
jgi:hypothetical protein